MPNWCNNSIEIYHEDPAKIEALVAAINDGKFCSHVIPTPKELKETVSGHCGDGYEQELNQFKIKLNQKYFGTTDWYSFQTSRWGTKWEVEPFNPVEIDDDSKSISFGFHSAWNPPTGVYEALVEQGFAVRAMYHEPGMAFAGIWEDGYDDFHELGSLSAEGLAKNLPRELDEAFDISKSMADRDSEL